MASFPSSQEDALECMKKILLHFFRGETSNIDIFLNTMKNKIEESLKLQKRDPGLVSCMVAWTCHLEMNDRTFYSLLNEAIRKDIPEIMDPIASLARGINSVCVRDRSGKKEDVSPPSNLPSYLVRCATIPDDKNIRSFFQKGKIYRCPMYLATSREDVKARKMFPLAPRGVPLVKWEVYLPSRDSLHGNNIFSEFDEGEYLFPPYSVFIVKETPNFSEKGTKEDPHVIKIFAVPDNRAFSEKLPLSPWN